MSAELLRRPRPSVEILKRERLLGLTPRVLGAALAIIAAGLWLYFIGTTLRGVLTEGSMIDSASYWATGQALLDHSDPYAPVVQPNGYAPAAYPPIFGIAVMPIALLPLQVGQLLWYSLSLALLAAACVITVRLIGPAWPLTGSRLAPYAIVALLAFLFYPVWTNAKLGQVGSLLFFLVVGSLLAHRTGRPVLAGVLLGIACAVKLPPVVLIGYALWVGWYQFGLSAIASFVGLQLISAVAYPDLVVEYWLRVVPTLNQRVPQEINLAPANLVTRLLPDLAGGLLPLVAVLSLALLALPFILAIGAKADQKRLYGPALVLLGAGVAAPLVENHHLLWLLLPVTILLTRFIQRRSVIGLAALAATFILLSQPFRIARLWVGASTPSASSEFLGGAVLEVGALLLCLLFLVTVLSDRFASKKLVQPVEALHAVS